MYVLRALALVAMGGHVGVACAGLVVTISPRRDAVAASAACPTRPFAQMWP